MECWGCYKCKRSLVMSVPFRTTRGGFFVCVDEKDCEQARATRRKVKP